MDKIENEELNHFMYIFQDCNVNFLIGSGCSTPYFGTLGNIELWLANLSTKLENEAITKQTYEYIKASLYKAYFEVAMADNSMALKFNFDNDTYETIESADSVAIKKEKYLKNTYLSYRNFFKRLNTLLYERRIKTVDKQINLFTSNIDIFQEKLIEDLNLQFNDGFNGMFQKQFSLSNFKISYYQKSLQYDNISEVPVFNLLKIHGSLTWKLESGNIFFCGLEQVDKVKSELEKVDLLDIVSLNNKSWEDNERDVSIEEIIEICDKVDPLPSSKDFISEYDKLQIVNPTKEKFKDTTFNKTYYELLRLYSNELEKENTALFVIGFSMADEHIRDITIRAIKSNPTLKLFIVSYSHGAKGIKDNFKKDGFIIEDFNNVEIVSPEDKFDLKKFNERILDPITKEIVDSNKQTIS